MYPSVFDSLNSVPALTNLTGDIGSLASSVAGGGPLGLTR